VSKLLQLADLLEQAAKALRDADASLAKGVRPPERIPLSALNLSVRANKALSRRADLDFVDELTDLTAGDLLELRNFGMTSLTEVRRKLEARGLYLKGEGPS
jgi:DNA-directed RNA polymerase subunit alpha